jgi:acetylornithine deacetylase
MKPTRLTGTTGSLNQIPPVASMSGDIRITPFYPPETVRAAIERYVAEINARFGEEGDFPRRCPIAGNKLADGRTARIELKWMAGQERGVACSLSSPGFSALCKAVKSVKGNAVPFSVGGTLPLVGDLQEAGFDLQIIGFGKSSVYHGDNEFCLFSDMADATVILARVVAELNVLNA